MKKKIAFFTIALTDGGAERVISNLLINLPDEKYEKTLILLDGDKITYPFKGTLIDLKTFKKNKGIFKYFNLIISFFKLFFLKKKMNYEVVISFLDIPNLMNIVSGRTSKRYVSVRTHVSNSYKGKKKIIYGNIIRFLYNYAEKVIAVSEECAKDLKENFKVKKEKLITIHNFYNLEKIKIMSEESITKEHKSIFEKKVIINTGRLTYQKGQKYLIKAFANLKNKEDYNLVILGEGNLEKELENLVKKLGIEKRVYFLGFQNNPFKFLKNSYLYLFPSFYEGFPNALAEAMACGLPVISNNCKSGPKELLENGKFGVLIEDYLNKEMLSYYLGKEIEKFENKKRYIEYQNKSKERIKEFEINRIIKNWENILEGEL